MGTLSDFFFFSSRRRHTRLQGDWSSAVCSSDLKSGRCTARTIGQNSGIALCTKHKQAVNASPSLRGGTAQMHSYTLGAGANPAAVKPRSTCITQQTCKFFTRRKAFLQKRSAYWPATDSAEPGRAHV